jgi:hypothetical protein
MNTASTSIPAIHQQGWRIRLFFTFLFGIDKFIDSAFLRLPLELRFMIYNEFINPESKNFILVEPPKAITALFWLSRISRQIRTEVHALVADTRICIRAGLTEKSGVRPYTTLRARSTGKETRRLQDWTAFNINAPREPKFWRVILSLTNTSGRVRFIADIDLRSKTVRVLGPSDDVDCEVFCDNWLSSKSEGEPSRAMSQNFKKYVINAVQMLVERKSFAGLTLRDIRPLLRDIKIPVPQCRTQDEEYGTLF